MPNVNVNFVPFSKTEVLLGRLLLDSVQKLGRLPIALPIVLLIVLPIVVPIVLPIVYIYI
jgi:hypothetical protein